MRILHAGTAIMAWLAGAALFGACEHDVDIDEPSAGPTFQTVSQRVFSDCALCHLGGAKSGGLSLEQYENIVTVKSLKKPEFSLIAPNDPDNSYILMKVRGDSRIDGSKMPPGSSLSREQIDHLEAWIKAGAPKAASGKPVSALYSGFSPAAAD